MASWADVFDRADLQDRSLATLGMTRSVAVRMKWIPAFAGMTANARLDRDDGNGAERLGALGDETLGMRPGRHVGTRTGEYRTAQTMRSAPPM